MNLQLSREFTNLRLDGCILVFVDRSTGFLYKVVCHLKGNAREFLSVGVWIGLSRDLGSTAQAVLLMCCGKLIPSEENDVQWNERVREGECLSYSCQSLVVLQLHGTHQ
jgi:hypothetical protein